MNQKVCGHFPENGGLRAENIYFWDVYPKKSMRWFGPTPKDTCMEQMF